jgi:hypothetical protein
MRPYQINKSKKAVGVAQIVKHLLGSTRPRVETPALPKKERKRTKPNLTRRSTYLGKATWILGVVILCKHFV